MHPGVPDKLMDQKNKRHLMMVAWHALIVADAFDKNTFLG